MRACNKRNPSVKLECRAFGGRSRGSTDRQFGSELREFFWPVTLFRSITFVFTAARGYPRPGGRSIRRILGPYLSKRTASALCCLKIENAPQVARFVGGTRRRQG